jgi:hypothetical protein
LRLLALVPSVHRHSRKGGAVASRYPPSHKLGRTAVPALLYATDSKSALLGRMVGSTT